MVSYSDEQIKDLIIQDFIGKRINILAPVIRARKGHYAELFQQITKQGFLKVRVNGGIQDLVSGMKLDRYKTHDIEIVVDRMLIENTPDNSLTLFDRGFYSLGLLHAWQSQGQNRHWLIPLKKGAQYEVIRKLGRQDVLVRLSASPQAKKKWSELPEQFEARLLTRTVNGKERQVLTSLTDPLRFPASELMELYQNRWEIELGYREMKHSLQQHRLTLRSKKPDGVRQELWGLVLAYNLLRYQMVRMAASLKGYTASQLSFHMASVYLLHELSCLPFVSPGMVPGRVAELDKQAEQFKLPARRERSYPRCIKAKPQKYATRKPSKNNASQA